MIFGKCISVLGHYGTGKTLLASEAVKMKLARFKETFKDVDHVYILTFNSSGTSYYHLMSDLKSKWFGGLDVSIQHFSDFLEMFTNKYEENLNQKQLKEFKFAKKFEFLDDGESFKIILITICEMMKKFSKTSIIMIDELELDIACRKTKKHGKTSYHVDFSYLAQYTNVNFVICMRPIRYEVKDFNVIFPTNKEGQH